MKKKHLNLEIKEIEQVVNPKIGISLMPCPCAAAYGGGTSLAGTGWGPSPPTPWGVFWSIMAPKPANNVDEIALMNAYGHGQGGNFGGDLSAFADSPDTGLI